MRIIPRHPHRLTVAAFTAGLAALGAGAVLAERTSVFADQRTIAQPELDVLPTMKGHMARLGTLMNFLFRELDEPDQKDAVLGVIDEMKRHLESVGRALLPDKVASITNHAWRMHAVAGFRSCVERSIGLLDQIAAAVGAEQGEAALSGLYELDQLRRDCHSEFAGLTAPGAAKAA